MSEKTETGVCECGPPWWPNADEDLCCTRFGKTLPDEAF